MLDSYFSIIIKKVENQTEILQLKWVHVILVMQLAHTQPIWKMHHEIV